MKKLNKKFFGIPLVAILVVVALMGIMGGAVMAVIDSTILDGSGTITVRNAYGYELDSEEVAFEDTTLFSNQAINIDSDILTFTNTGNQIVTGFELSDIGIPVGMVLNVTPNSSLLIPRNGTIDLTFHITSVSDGVAPAIYNLAELAAFCDLTPTSIPLSFDTVITRDGVNLDGTLATGFTIEQDADIAMRTLSLVNTDSNFVPEDGLYAFKLVAGVEQQTTLTEYFATKGWPAEYITQIGAEINGSSPFFFLSVSGDTFTLVDGFRYVLGDTDAALTIDGDYPIGTYTYTGVIEGINGEAIDITVTLNVVAETNIPE